LRLVLSFKLKEQPEDLMPSSDRPIGKQSLSHATPFAVLISIALVSLAFCGDDLEREFSSSQHGNVEKRRLSRHYWKIVSIAKR
jgi:hypothetical protein